MVTLALKIKGCAEPYLIKLPRSLHGATNAALKLSLKIMSILTSYQSYCGLAGVYGSWTCTRKVYTVQDL